MRLCVAGTVGFEPTNVGVRTRCLTRLGDVPTVYFYIYKIGGECRI